MNKITFQRELCPKIRSFLDKYPDVIHVLVGPRQVGKTTIAKQIIADLPFPSIYASADTPLPPGPEWIETQWNRAVLKAETEKNKVLLVLDEIQKVRGWSEVLKRLWDEQKINNKTGGNIRLLALGSSALLISKGLTESLAGRFFLWRCPHWSFQECKKAFGWGLEQWLYFGGYPGAAPFATDCAAWKQYVADSLIETVISKDVLQMQNVAKPALLRHLFMLVASYPAQLLSYNKMLGQLHDAGNATTLAHYLKLLETAFLISGLPRFSGSKIRQRSSSPKLILWNNALVNALQPKEFDDAFADSAWWGRLVENAAGAHFLNEMDVAKYKLFYWREGRLEMDFVLEQGVQILAVEVKSGRADKKSGFSEFKHRFPNAGCLVLGSGGMPLEEFFNAPVADLLKTVSRRVRL